MNRRFEDKIIPFYGGEHSHLFEIERRCMDRDGKVIDFLNQHLPNGTVLDVGAGSGHTAIRLTTPGRMVIPMEPDKSMIDDTLPLLWAWGVAQEIPFHNGTFDAAYSTWAFFFDGINDIDNGLAELNRVVKPNGPLLIIDNAGGDEFCALSPREIASNPNRWKSRGFDCNIIDTSFRFDSLGEANELLSFYFGSDVAERNNATEIEYKVAAYMKKAETPL